MLRHIIYFLIFFHILIAAAASLIGLFFCLLAGKYLYALLLWPSFLVFMGGAIYSVERGRKV